MVESILENIPSTRELLIIGNGFDLDCGLKTRYKDFFFDKYGINLIAEVYEDQDKDKNKLFKDYQDMAAQRFIAIFSTAIKEKLDVEKFLQFNGNANGYLVNYFTQKFRSEFLTIDFDIENDDLKQEFNKKSNPKFTNWDVIFISSYVLMNDGNNFKWNDIEKAIFEVVTTVLMPEKEVFTDHYFLDEDSKQKFINIVRYCFKENKEISISMLDSLIKFEKSFAKYIAQQLNDEGIKYLQTAARLLSLLTKASDNMQVNLDVINFNYSLDENIVEYMKKKGELPNIQIHSWTNIHGIAFWNSPRTRSHINKIHGRRKGKLSSPIFGIDGHDVLSPQTDKILNLDDPRIVFTKSFRLLDNQINSMRDKEHQFLNKVDKIIFFGHSLGHADYSYFETLFDIYDIFNSNVELEFYYHQHEESLKDRVSERRTLKQIVNLLTSYGETLPEQHGEDIVNRLVLEQRMSLLPSPSVNDK